MKSTISYDVFDQLDLRVGRVVSATAPDWSKKLLELVVDFGDELGQRTIFSGIKLWYQPEDLLDKSFPFLINLEPKKMGEKISAGMMLMADGDIPQLIPLSGQIIVGSALK